MRVHLQQLVLCSQDAILVHGAPGHHAGEVVVAVVRVQLQAQAKRVDGKELRANATRHTPHVTSRHVTSGHVTSRHAGGNRATGVRHLGGPLRLGVVLKRRMQLDHLKEGRVLESHPCNNSLAWSIGPLQLRSATLPSVCL